MGNGLGLQHITPNSMVYARAYCRVQIADTDSEYAAYIHTVSTIYLLATVLVYNSCRPAGTTDGIRHCTSMSTE